MLSRNEARLSIEVRINSTISKQLLNVPYDFAAIPMKFTQLRVFCCIHHYMATFLEAHLGLIVEHQELWEIFDSILPGRISPPCMIP